LQQSVRLFDVYGIHDSSGLGGRAVIGIKFNEIIFRRPEGILRLGHNRR